MGEGGGGVVLLKGKFTKGTVIALDISRQVFLLPDLSKGHNYTDFAETSATSLRLA